MLLAMPAAATKKQVNHPAKSGVSEPSGRRSAFRFIALLAALMLVFNLVVYRGGAASGWWEPYLALNAKAAALVLSLLGHPVTADGVALNSPAFSMSIATGCDAVQASAFFVFAILLSPVGVALSRCLVPVFVGLVVLAVINVVRIVSLYLIGVYYVKAFDFVHGELWQLLFILLPLTLWLGWLRAATREPKSVEHVAE